MSPWLLPVMDSQQEVRCRETQEAVLWLFILDPKSRDRSTLQQSKTLTTIDICNLCACVFFFMCMCWCLGESRVSLNHSVAGIHYYRWWFVPKSTPTASFSPTACVLQVKAVELFSPSSYFIVRSLSVHRRKNKGATSAPFKSLVQKSRYTYLLGTRDC